MGAVVRGTGLSRASSVSEPVSVCRSLVRPRSKASCRHSTRSLRISLELGPPRSRDDFGLSLWSLSRSVGWGVNVVRIVETVLLPLLTAARSRSGQAALLTNWVSLTSSSSVGERGLKGADGGRS